MTDNINTKSEHIGGRGGGDDLESKQATSKKHTHHRLPIRIIRQHPLQLRVARGCARRGRECGLVEREVVHALGLWEGTEGFREGRERGE